jgi:hypothetical protein
MVDTRKDFAMADQMINLLSRAAFEQFLDKVIDGDLLPDQVDAAEKASPYLGVYLLPGQVDLARAADRALTKLETTESINRTWGREEEALAALRQAIGDRVRSRADQDEFNSLTAEELDARGIPY